MFVDQKTDNKYEFKLKSATNVVNGGTEKLACGGNCMECSGYQCVANKEVLTEKKDK